MKYDNPELRDRLAAEYVLGTLAGRTRRRFERLLAEDRALAEAVERWELHLNPLVEGVPPIEPPARLWQAIERRIAAPPRPLARRPGLWHSLGFWRGFGLAAGAVAAALALYLGVAPPPPAPAPLAVLADGAGHPAWLIAADAGARRITLRAVAARPAEPGRVYELWLLPKGGGRPRPLGLLPASGSAALELSREDASILPQADGLAISLEPAGGSPTGLPTGPVLFKGAVLASS